MTENGAPTTRGVLVAAGPFVAVNCASIPLTGLEGRLLGLDRRTLHRRLEKYEADHPQQPHLSVNDSLMIRAR